MQSRSIGAKRIWNKNLQTKITVSFVLRMLLFKMSEESF